MSKMFVLMMTINVTGAAYDMLPNPEHTSTTTTNNNNNKNNNNNENLGRIIINNSYKAPFFNQS